MEGGSARRTSAAIGGLPLNSTAIYIDQDGTLLVGLRNPTTGGQVPHLLRGGTPDRPVRAAQDRHLNCRGHRQRPRGRRCLHPLGPDQGVAWDQAGSPTALPSSTEGLLVNRDGDHAYTGALGDDGTFAGTLRGLPTVWRCS